MLKVKYIKKEKFILMGSFLFAIFFVLGNIVWGADSETTVSKNTETVILKDTDGDGILDKDDPHPDIAEIYIVFDDNKNGIVDNFEK